MCDTPNTLNAPILRVAGRDRIDDLGAAIDSDAAASDDPVFRDRIQGESVILDLANAASESDYHDRQLAIHGMRTQLDLAELSPPQSTGVVGPVVGSLRKFLWRMTRFGLDWTVFHQNGINEQAARTLEHEVRLRKRENEALRERIAALESRLDLVDGDAS